MLNINKKIGLVWLIFLSGSLFTANISAANKYFGTALCDHPDYKCVKIKRGQTWKKFLPDPMHRDLVQRLNRTNMYLWRGRKIVVPNNLDQLDYFDLAPFPMYMKTDNGKVIVVDQEKLAWGAYSQEGNLIKWGPISSGKNFCKDINRSCKTRTGEFYIFSKKNERCRSNIYPVGRGGSHMPYCMFFHRGFALHGSPYVPGHRDSHGCVRLFTSDAKWLNEEFVTTTDNDTYEAGTKVIIQELTHTGGGKNGRT